MDTKQDKLAQIIAVCVKNDKDPSKTVAFAEFVNRVCTQVYGFDKRASKPYLDTVIRAFRTDKWKKYVQTSPYLPQELIDKWIASH